MSSKTKEHKNAKARKLYNENIEESRKYCREKYYKRTGGKPRQEKIIKDKKIKKCKECGTTENLMIGKKNNKTYICNECRKCYNKRKTKDTINRRKNNLILKLRSNISSSIRKLLKNSNLNKSGVSILNILDYSLIDFKAHLEKQFESWMTWDNWGTYKINEWNDNDSSTWRWHIDHIIPQSSFNFSSIEDENFKKCWSLENLRPLSAKQNVLDGNRR